MKNRRTIAEARDEFIRDHGGDCSVEEAEQRIIAEFASGQRRAEGVLPGGIEYEPISEALWQQAVKPAAVTESEPHWLRGVPVVAVDFKSGTAIARTAGHRGFVHIREVLDAPVTANQASPPAVPSPVPQKPKNPGGAPPKYDWDRIMIEIVRIANSLDGLPDRPTLMKLLYNTMSEEWRWYDLPSETSMKNRLRAIYDNLDPWE